MGFYSFYRLIKDVLRGFLGNRSIRIIAIVGLLILLLSVYNKVNGVYISDTNGYFENSTELSNNQTNITLNNLSVTIPTSFYNNNAFLIKPAYDSSGNIYRMYVYYTNGNLKYNFTNDTFTSTQTIYRGYSAVMGTAINLNYLTSTSSYGANANVPSFFSSSYTYDVAFYGTLYDVSNDNIVLPPQVAGSSFEISDPQYTFNLDSKYNDYTYRYFLTNSNFEYQDNEYTRKNVLILSSSPVTFSQQVFTNSVTGSKVLRTYINTENNSSFYLYVENTNKNADLQSVVLPTFNTYVNNSDNLVASGSGVDFEKFGQTTNDQFYNFTSLYLSQSIYFQNGTIAFPDSNYVYPYFEPSNTDISNLNFNNIYVEFGSYDLESKPLYIHVLQISNTVTENNEVIYYYNDKSILLEKDGKYYRQYLDSDNHYFSLSKAVFTFDVNSSYVLVLSNYNDNISNTVGLIEKNVSQGIFEAVAIDTAGVITQAEADHDIFLQNEQHLQDIANGVTSVENTLNNSNVSEDTQGDINTNLNFNNNNSTLTNLYGGFFSRLTTLLSSLGSYNLSEDTTINIPMPNSDRNIVLHSNILYQHLPQAIQALFQAFWLYIFTFYLYKFINKIYIAISSGSILDTFSSSGEAITNNML